VGKLAIGDVAPGFTLYDCYGNHVSLEDMRGKKVLLYFFTSPGGGN
jgi:peroxiredoxin